MISSKTFNAAIVAATLAGVVGFVLAQAQAADPHAREPARSAHADAAPRVAQAVPPARVGRS